MKLLLGSGGFSTPERKRAWSRELDRFLGPIERFLFIPYALADYDLYEKKMKDSGFHSGRQIDMIHRATNPIAAIQEATAVFIGGGNSFRLLNQLQSLQLLAPLQNKIRSGTPYIGVSAGTNMACPTLKTTNDMPIVQPASFEALGLIPFQINPHYFSGAFHVQTETGLSPYGGETRDDRIREFHEMNEVPVLGLYEGSVLRFENERYQLTLGGARLFKRGEVARELIEGTDLNEMMTEYL